MGLRRVLLQREEVGTGDVVHMDEVPALAAVLVHPRTLASRERRPEYRRHPGVGRIPRHARPVDIVIAGDSGDEPKVLAEVPTQALAEQLFPAVAVLGGRGIGVALAQWSDIGSELMLLGIDTGRR